jgi:hypothetical protein
MKNPGSMGASRTALCRWWNSHHDLVPSIDGCIAHIEQTGDHVVQPKTTIDQAGDIRYRTDIEGNTIGVYDTEPFSSLAWPTRRVATWPDPQASPLRYLK